MGFFSNLGDALSGKIYKQNTLIGSNIAKLLEKSQRLPDSKFIKRWSFVCMASIQVILEKLLFSNAISSDINVFKRNINKLNQDKVFELIKLLAGFHLSAFTSNEGNLAFLKIARLTKEEFDDDVFLIFSFTKDDKKLFKELDEKYKSNGAKYSICLYRALLKNGFDISEECDIFAVMAIRTIIHAAYQNFMDTLECEVKKL